MNANPRFWSEDETPDRGSYSQAIRNRLMATAMDLPFFANFMPRLTRALPINPDDLPILACYKGEETMLPDGELSADGLKFIVTVRLGWSIMIAESDKEAAERQLDGAYVALIYGLWCNPYITSMFDTTDPDTGVRTEYNARIEGVPRQLARIQWGAPFLDNTSPFDELQFDMTLQYRRAFSPTLIHDLEEIQITTAHPAGRTPEQIAQIQQVRQQLLFTTPTPRKETFNG
jgi:hypothetical protein